MMNIVGNNGKNANIKTGWIVDEENKQTTLVSIYITDKKLKKAGE